MLLNIIENFSTFISLVLALLAVMASIWSICATNKNNNRNHQINNFKFAYLELKIALKDFLAHNQFINCEVESYARHSEKNYGYNVTAFQNIINKELSTGGTIQPIKIKSYLEAYNEIKKLSEEIANKFNINIYKNLLTGDIFLNSSFAILDIAYKTYEHWKKQEKNAEPLTRGSLYNIKKPK